MKHPRKIPSTPVIALLSNTAWSMFNFRKGLMQALVSAGYKVIVIAPRDKYASQIETWGCTFEHVTINRYHGNFVDDWRYIRQLYRVFKKHHVQFVISYTIKPNIFGSMLAHVLGIPAIAVITGLGQLFTNPSWKTQLVKPLYKLALRAVHQIWFLNREDQAIFQSLQLCTAEKSVYLPSEGVDTVHLTKSYLNGKSPEHFTFLFAGRLMEEKGIREYVAAAETIRRQFPKVNFDILGFIETGYPTAISEAEILGWQNKGVIRFHGATDDIKEALQNSDCLVLPSYYREGVPKILLEAASMEKTIITTDNVGCRDIVQHGVNGFLCQSKNADNLAHWMEQILLLPYPERRRMGSNSRELVVRQFEETLIVNRYLATLQQFLPLPITRPESTTPDPAEELTLELIDKENSQESLAYKNPY